MENKTDKNHVQIQTKKFKLDEILKNKEGIVLVAKQNTGMCWISEHKDINSQDNSKQNQIKKSSLM